MSRLVGDVFEELPIGEVLLVLMGELSAVINARHETLERGPTADVQRAELTHRFAHGTLEVIDSGRERSRQPARKKPV